VNVEDQEGRTLLFWMAIKREVRAIEEEEEDRWW